MAFMSNNQWTGAQDWNAQPQQSNAQDWNAQPQQSHDWSQQSAQDWSAPSQEWGTQAQEQTSVQPAQDWGAPAQEQTTIAPSQDWNAQPQQSVPSAPEWGTTPGQEQTAQQPTQDWNQQAAWGSAQQAQQSQQPQQWGGQQQPSYGGQQQWAPKQPASGFGAIFDFGFKGSLLKGGLGSVYMASTIAVGVIVVFTIFKELTAPQGYVFSGGGSSVAVGQILWGLFAPVGAGLIALILIRALLEALASVVKKSDQE
jgi:hypothetical protein